MQSVEMQVAAPFLVKLDMRRLDGCLSAVCDDVPGLHVRGDTAEAVRQEAARAIQALYWFNDKVRVDVGLTDDLTVLRVQPQ
jgi:predicted RNase H-like HicB family nuclease